MRVARRSQTDHAAGGHDRRLGLWAPRTKRMDGAAAAAQRVNVAEGMGFAPSKFALAARS